MRLSRSAVAGVAVATLMVSPAAAQQDLRSPDTRDAAERSTTWIAPEDGLPAFPTPSVPSPPRQDLRSPDTRDAAEGRGTADAPHWADAGMGAAVMLVLTAASVLAVVLRRRTHAQTAIPA
jgi:hypothetical protein